MTLRAQAESHGDGGDEWGSHLKCDASSDALELQNLCQLLRFWQGPRKKTSENSIGTNGVSGRAEALKLLEQIAARHSVYSPNIIRLPPSATGIQRAPEHLELLYDTQLVYPVPDKASAINPPPCPQRKEAGAAAPTSQPRRPAQRHRLETKMPWTLTHRCLQGHLLPPRRPSPSSTPKTPGRTTSSPRCSKLW